MANPATIMVPQCLQGDLRGPQSPQSLLTYIRNSQRSFIFNFNFLIFFLLFSPAQSSLVDFPECLCPKRHKGVKNVIHALDKFIRRGLENEKQMKFLFSLDFLSRQRLVFPIQQLRPQQSIQVISTTRTLETCTEGI